MAREVSSSFDTPQAAQREANMKSESGIKREQGNRLGRSLKREHDTEYENLLASEYERKKPRPSADEDIVVLD